MALLCSVSVEKHEAKYVFVDDAEKWLKVLKGKLFLVSRM